jgi:hypothetical protein
MNYTLNSFSIIIEKIHNNSSNIYHIIKKDKISMISNVQEIGYSRFWTKILTVRGNPIWEVLFKF